MSDSKIEIRKLAFGDWSWSCPVCHWGENIPWRDTTSHRDAVADAESHIALHRSAGKRLEWICV